MTKEIMQRSARDNEYLHKDFHGALSAGIEYLRTRYGEDAVREYLRQFAISLYAPLVSEINTRGLAALKEHLERIYSIEGGEIEISSSDDELLLTVITDPAIAHMRENGYAISPAYGEVDRTVYTALCEGTPFAYELLLRDEETGRGKHRFFRRQDDIVH